MSVKQDKIFTPFGILLDLVLAVLIFFIFFLKIIPSFVPVEETISRLILIGYTSFIMAVFFWMILTLFRVARVDHRRQKTSKALQ